MIVQYTLSNISFNIIMLITRVRLTFFSRPLDNFNIVEKDKENNIVHQKVDKLQINQQAERLLDEYGNSILRLAYSYLHHMSDAEDVLQDTIIQYIKNSPSFQSPIHEKAWLIRVAINISKNKIISKKRRETLELDESLFVEEEKDLKFVWDAVKGLPSKYSEVIHLFYHEGYTTAQIAKILSKNESTVRSLLHRGREKLKVILKEMYDFHE